MTNDEALRIGRKAVEGARKKVGGKRSELIKELEKKAVRDKKLAQALLAVGHLLLESSQQIKH